MSRHKVPETLGPRASSMISWTVYYKEHCRPCRSLSKLAVFLSGGTLRRASLNSQEARALHRIHPEWRGQLLMIENGRISLGSEVFYRLPSLLLIRYFQSRSVDPTVKKG